MRQHRLSVSITGQAILRAKAEDLPLDTTRAWAGYKVFPGEEHSSCFAKSDTDDLVTVYE
jgi:hypothetical protein